MPKPIQPSTFYIQYSKRRAKAADLSHDVKYIAVDIIGGLRTPRLISPVRYVASAMDVECGKGDFFAEKGAFAVAYVLSVIFSHVLYTG